MTDFLVQAALAAFSVAALVMALSKNATAAKWSSFVGLIGQPFWFIFTWRSGAWGVLGIVGIYTAVYLVHFVAQWGPGWLAWWQGIDDSHPWRSVIEELQKSDFLRLDQDDSRAEQANLESDIAVEAAIAEVEVNARQLSGTDWFSVGADNPFLIRAARYLELRGRVARHSTDSALMRFTP